MVSRSQGGRGQGAQDTATPENQITREKGFRGHEEGFLEEVGLKHILARERWL